MSDIIENQQVALSVVRLSFPKVFKAEQYVSGGKPSGNPRYSATFHIEPGSENFKRIETAIKQAAKDVWKDKAEAKLKSFRGNSNKFCFIDGDTKDDENVAGLWVLTSHRAEKLGRPGVYDRNRNPLQESDNKIYAGAWVNARVEIWAQEGENSGIRCKLVSLQFVKDGDPLGGGGRKPSADDYDVIEEEELA